MIDSTPNSMDWTMQMAMQEVLLEDPPPDKLLIIGLWDDAENYSTRFWNVGMSASQMIALLEVEKQRILKYMERTEDEY